MERIYEQEGTVLTLIRPKNEARSGQLVDRTSRRPVHRPVPEPSRSNPNVTTTTAEEEEETSEGGKKSIAFQAAVASTPNSITPTMRKRPPRPTIFNPMNMPSETAASTPRRPASSVLGSASAESHQVIRAYPFLPQPTFVMMLWAKNESFQYIGNECFRCW